MASSDFHPLQKTSQDKLPNLARGNWAHEGTVDSRNPGISSNVEIPLSARSSSGFWISRASSSTFFAFDIFPAGIHDTGAWFIARAIVPTRQRALNKHARTSRDDAHWLHCCHFILWVELLAPITARCSPSTSRLRSIGTFSCSLFSFKEYFVYFEEDAGAVLVGWDYIYCFVFVEFIETKYMRYSRRRGMEYLLEKNLQFILGLFSIWSPISFVAIK